MKNIFKNKSILITGASGSIGSALLKSLIKMNCKVIRAMSNDENGLFEISEDIFNSSTNKIKKNYYSFRERMKRKKIRILYGDIRDYKRCLSATKNIDIVIHAAAVKHVPICQYNPLEAFKTNVKGTRNLCKASLKNKVKKFLLISTDKVVEPTSIMGSTKQKAEKITIRSNFSRNSKTKFSCIRFGNIVGSRGSIVPLFTNQIRNNMPITITDKKMTRFFMSLAGSVNLIKRSISLMRGNEIFILKSMHSFRVIDMAIVLNNLISGKKIINFKLIGIRPGEKIYESLFSKNEINHLYENKDMFIINKSLEIKKILKFYKAKIAKNLGIHRSDNPKFILKRNIIKKFISKNFAFKGPLMKIRNKKK